MSTQTELIDRALDALERLMRMFAFERYLYLICAIFSFVLLLVSIVFLFFIKPPETLSMGTLATAAGLIGAASFRVSFFLNKSFDLISSIINQIARVEPQGNDEEDDPDGE